MSDECWIPYGNSTEMVGWKFSKSRGTFDIIFACIVTTALCACMALHNNLPLCYEQEEGRLVSRPLTFLEKVHYQIDNILTSWAGPELLLGNYLGLWWAARKYVEILKQSRHSPFEGWGYCHVRFAMMEGFKYEKATVRIENILSFKTTEGKEVDKNMANGGREKLRVLMEKEISDKGKSDTAGRIIVICQAGWFAVNFIIRATKLQFTALEVSTFANTVLFIPIFLLCWGAPRDFKTPVCIPGGLFPGWDLAVSNNCICGFGQGEIYSALVLSRAKPCTCKLEGDLKNRMEKIRREQFYLQAIGGFIGSLIYSGIYFISLKVHFPSKAERQIWLIGLFLHLFLVLHQFLCFFSYASQSIELASNSKALKCFISFCGFVQKYSILTVKDQPVAPLLTLFGFLRIMFFVLSLISFRKLPEGVYATFY